MNRLIILILTLLILLAGDSVLADSGKEFDANLENWNEKISLASKYLEDAEKELKNGDAIQGCINQKKAAKYGIEATESLIKAFKESGSEQDISNIKSGLDKWKELRDFC